MAVVWPSARARPGGFTEGRRPDDGTTSPKGAQHNTFSTKYCTMTHQKGHNHWNMVLGFYSKPSWNTKMAPQPKPLWQTEPQHNHVKHEAGETNPAQQVFIGHASFYDS